MTVELDDRRTAYLFLALLQARVGRSLVCRLAAGDPEAILRPVPEELAGIGGSALRAHAQLREEFDPERLLAGLDEKGLHVLTPSDSGYPGRLLQIPDPPPALFVGGTLPAGITGGGTAVAVVGSRKASPAGLDTARALGRALGERGACVVSGLALGVDGAAHAGALDGGGSTVGVLGCGIDVVYPRAHRELFGRVSAIVSEYFLGEAPLAWRFPARNRIIAGLCDAVVVVEAGEKSGALITARHALESGRDVWAVPGPPGMRECRGSNRLLADGAAVLWDVPEFLEAVVVKTGGERTGDAPLASPVPAGLPGTEAAVLSGVGIEPAGVDLVAGRSGVAMDELLPALALLELKGYVSRDRDGAYSRRCTP
ncbi:MAG TPA: DNA-processing protein DprA [Rubrobacteraceae bacterium]|nr:DNA-processing protein DprA [Rubrobacteraceae bacterium]